MRNFNKLFNKILQQNQNLIKNCIYQQVIFNQQILPLSQEELLQSLEYMQQIKDNKINLLNEKSNQKYFVQLPQQLELLINENKNKDIKDELITAIFPQLQLIQNRPHIFCGLFSFSDLNSVSKFLNSIAKIKHKSVYFTFQLAVDKNNNGVCIDLRRINSKLNLIFLLFNEDNYTRRIIYHEFTHYLQRVVGNKYLTILNANIKRTKIVAQKLSKFNLTLDAVYKIYFSDSQYVAQVDNLIYLIKQVWKFYSEKYQTKSQLLKKFILQFSTDNVQIFQSSQFAKDIIAVNKTFKNSILFFICAFICFQKSLFLDLCFKLQQKFLN